MAPSDVDLSWLTLEADTNTTPSSPSLEEQDLIALFDQLERIMEASCDDEQLEDVLGRFQLNDDSDHDMVDSEDGAGAFVLPSNKSSRMLQAYELHHEGAGKEPMRSTGPADLEDTPREIREAKVPMELYPYQLAGAGRLSSILQRFRAALFAWEMGLGKTVTMLGKSFEFSGTVMRTNDTTATLLEMGFMAENSSQSGPILLTLPTGLIKSPWVESLKTNLRKTPRICVYRDALQGRGDPDYAGITYTNDLSSSQLSAFDVVITTYAAVRNEFMVMKHTGSVWRRWREKRLPWNVPERGKFPLFANKWEYLIMDEAHQAANPSSLVNRAICCLDATFRIAMTGTPLQNAISDIQGLLAILHIEPWSSYEFFRGHYKQKPRKGREALTGTLKTTLVCTLRAITLRLRVVDSFNDEQAARFNKVKPVVVYHELDSDQDSYQQPLRHLWDPDAKAERLSAKARGEYIGCGYDEGGVFRAITEARLAAIHPGCATAKYGDKEHCDNIAVQRVVKLIGIVDDSKLRKRKTEPQQSEKERRKAFRADMEEGWDSSRLREVVKIANEQKQRGRKFVVFSNYVCALDVADAALQAQGLSTLRYDGGLPQRERDKVIDDFRSEDHDALLMTLKSGGAGLNLQMAKSVLQLDLCWNPSTLAQANGRVNRNGNDDVEIYYFIAKHSFESYVWNTAENKRQVADILLDPDEEEEENIKAAANWSFRFFEDIMDQASMTAANYAAQLRQQDEKRKATLSKKKNGKTGSLVDHEDLLDDGEPVSAQNSDGEESMEDDSDPDSDAGQSMHGTIDEFGDEDVASEEASDNEIDLYEDEMIFGANAAWLMKH